MHQNKFRMRQIFLLIILFFFFAGCKKNRFDVDLSNVELSTPIHRFDKDLAAFSRPDSTTSIKQLQEQYGNFFKFYNYQILNIGTSSDANYTSYLSTFLEHEVYSEVYKEVLNTFTDLSKQEDVLSDALKRYHYFFPEKQIPAIYTYVSGFNTAIAVADSIIGISLDDYLGADNKFYQQLEIFQYKLANMAPEKIPSDCMLGWLLTEFPSNFSKRDLLSEIIYRGTILYVMQALMPDENLNLLIGYTPKQYKWAVEHEGEMWRYMIEWKHLFTTNQLTIKKYIGEAPFTYFFAQESAPQGGVFVGWQIVKAYMGLHPEMSLQELIKLSNAQHILEQSGYNP